MDTRISTRQAVAPAVSHGPTARGFRGVALAAQAHRQLERAADAARRNGPGFRPPDTEARNAHVTNTRQEMLAALKGSFHWMEGDIRMRDGRPVMAHDVDANGLTLKHWIALVARSGRGLKMDFKEGAALAPAVRMTKAAGLAGRTLIFNIGIDQQTPAHVRVIRRAFPTATINLSPDGSSAKAIGMARQAAEDVRRAERELGIPPGPIAFPMDIQELTEAKVRELRQSGDVAVWNDPKRWRTDDVEAVRKKLISWGVNGIIDLRS